MSEATSVLHGGTVALEEVAAKTICDLPDRIGEEVLFSSGRAVLSGSVLLPKARPPHPAVVMVEGSGSYSYRRHWGHDVFPFWKLIAEEMLRFGFAVLLFDKPGVGKSTGNWRRQSFVDRSDDVLAAIAFLKSRPDIDGRVIGVVGHSQGGWIAQLAAARGRDAVSFLISLAGPAVTVKEQIMDDARGEWICKGSSKASIALRSIGWRIGLGLLSMVALFVKPFYLARIISYDPKDALTYITQPMLAIFGENDRLVPPENNVRRLKSYFGSISGNDRLVIVTVPSANHGFCKANSCSDGDETELRFADGFIEALNGWCVARRR